MNGFIMFKLIVLVGTVVQDIAEYYLLVDLKGESIYKSSLLKTPKQLLQ